MEVKPIKAKKVPKAISVLYNCSDASFEVLDNPAFRTEGVIYRATAIVEVQEDVMRLFIPDFFVSHVKYNKPTLIEEANNA